MTTEKEVIEGSKQDNYTPPIHANKQVINLVNDVLVTEDKEKKYYLQIK